MEYVKELDHFELNSPSVITLGKFDGVHRGHRKLIGRVKEIGRQKDLKTVIFTFDISPQVRMGAMKASMLMTNRERYNILLSILEEGEAGIRSFCAGWADSAALRWRCWRRKKTGNGISAAAISAKS